MKPFFDNGATGHYTQVVWADTREVGCGYIQYKDATQSNPIRQVRIIVTVDLHTDRPAAPKLPNHSCQKM